MTQDETEIVLDVPLTGDLFMVVGIADGPKGLGWYGQVRVGNKILTGGPFDTEEKATASAERLAQRIAAAMREQGIDIVYTPPKWIETGVGGSC